MSKQNTYKHPSVLLLLVLLGMSVLVYQTSHDYMQSSLVVSAKAISDAPNAKSEDHQSKVTVASQDVFLSVSTIQVDQVYHQIKEIVFGDDKKEKHTHVVTKYVSSFLKTLFRQVISPNAP
ncbi:MAG: hypothetical protein L3J06_09710 [Cyclobacteriaceae bacterium]|nr:hypothetical protein [Cyclobacteriaceae bacterium]